jgi:hypothetical protein
MWRRDQRAGEKTDNKDVGHRIGIDKGNERITAWVEPLSLDAEVVCAFGNLGKGPRNRLIGAITGSGVDSLCIEIVSVFCGVVRIL